MSRPIAQFPAEAVEADLWLMGQAPRPCTIAKLADNNLIFISLHDTPPADAEGAMPDDPADLMVESGSTQGRLRIRTRISNRTRERWVLEPITSNHEFLPQLQEIIQAGQQGANDSGYLRQDGATNRVAIIAECRRHVSRYLASNYGAFYTKLDDALVMAASSAPGKAEFIGAIHTLEQSHHQLEHSFIERSCWLIDATTEPDFEPIDANFSKLPEDIDGLVTESDVLSLPLLAGACAATHEQLLDDLSQRFSSTIHRLCDNNTLPFGTAWLCHHFDDTIAGLHLPSEILQVMYRVFRDTVLANLDTLYSQLNDTFASYNVLPELHEGKDWLQQARVSDTEVNSESNQQVEQHVWQRGINGDTGQLWQAALALKLTHLGQRPAQTTTRLLAQKSQLWLPGQQDPMRDPTTAASIELLHQMLERLVKHEYIATEAQPLLEKLELVVAQRCMEDSSFFLDPDNLARQCLNLIVWLCHENRYSRGTIGRQLEAICDRIVRQGSDNAAVFQAVLPSLQQLANRQRAAIQRNAQRVGAMQQSQFNFQQAHQDVEEQLYQRYAANPFPQLLQDLLETGWRKYLIHLRLNPQPAGNTWQQGLAVLHGLYCALVPSERRSLEMPRYQTVQPFPLTSHLVDPLDTLGICTSRYQEVVTQLQTQLEHCADTVMLPGYPQPGEQADNPDNTPPPAARWMLRCAELRTGDWLGWLDNPDDEPIQLAWSAPDRSRYVFVNESGHQLFEWSREALAQHMSHGLQQLADPDSWPAVDHVLFEILQQQHRNIVELSNKDSATTVLNRYGFEANLAEIGKLARYSQAEHTLVGLQLESAVIVGDTMDPDQRDSLLHRCGKLINEHFPAPALVGRYDNDCFSILVPNHTPALTETRAVALAETLANDPHLTGCHFNLGRVAVNRNSSSTATLFQQLEGQLYQARRSTSRIVWQNLDDHQREQEVMLGWITELGEILEQDRLRLRCQAITPLADGELRHEILLGVANEDGSVRPPGELIAAAERYQRMDIIDRWVIQHTLEWFRKNPLQAESLGPVHIKLSGNSLGNDLFLGFLLAQLDQAQVPAQMLCFEISEHAATINLPRAADFIVRLQAKGCKFALEHVGTSDNSYDYLRKLPMDFLKIDGSLVNSMASENSLARRVDAINRISHFMHIPTIAECVENESVLTLLESLGVDYAQGFGIAKPTLLSDA